MELLPKGKNSLEILKQSAEKSTAGDLPAVLFSLFEPRSVMALLPRNEPVYPSTRQRPGEVESAKQPLLSS